MQILVLRIYQAAGKGRRTTRPQPSDLCPSTLLFALGPEALKLFVAREPLERVQLERVHECVFAVLALESEAIDPRH